MTEIADMQPDPDNVVPLRRPMTDEEYERAYQNLVDTYGGEDRHDMTARRAMALARLLYNSGWTEQKIAVRQGKTQAWVSQQLKFARALELAGENITRVIGPLNEGKFRRYLNQTDLNKPENERFKEAFNLIIEAQRNPDPQPTRALLDRIMAQYADGRWHALDSLTADLQVTPALVDKAIRLLPRTRYRAKVETKQVGVRPHYRIFRGDRMISLDEIKLKFGPLIKELKQQGRTNLATVSIPGILTMAHELERIIDNWAA